MIWAIKKLRFLIYIALCQYTVCIQVELLIHYVLRLSVLSLIEFIIFAVDLTSAEQVCEKTTAADSTDQWQKIPSLSQKSLRLSYWTWCQCFRAFSHDLHKEDWFWVGSFSRREDTESFMRISHSLSDRTQNTRHPTLPLLIGSLHKRLSDMIVHCLCTSRWCNSITFEL